MEMIVQQNFKAQERRSETECEASKLSYFFLPTLLYEKCEMMMIFSFFNTVYIIDLVLLQETLTNECFLLHSNVKYSISQAEKEMKKYSQKYIINRSLIHTRLSSFFLFNFSLILCYLSLWHVLERIGTIKLTINNNIVLMVSLNNSLWCCANDDYLVSRST